MLDFDYLDRKLLSVQLLSVLMVALVGLDNLAAAIGEERDTIEDVLEPYLIQQGFYKERRVAVLQHPQTYRHFGLQKLSD